MPTSLHPQAKFDPIPPDLDLYGLVDRTPNFKWVQRVSRTQIRHLGQQEFEKVVKMHVIEGGKPLVVDGWDTAFPKGLFSARWLQDNYDKKQENVRDIGTSTDMPMTTGHYLRSMKLLTNQWTPDNFRDERRQRLYLKDIDCTREWRDALEKVVHPSLFYLNENVNSHSNRRNTNEDDDDDDMTPDQPAAPAGDLMSSLPEEMRAQNLMCYIGHEGTYTPAHREMCASLGQNIMVEASGDTDGEKPGSSLWFMTESKDREVVREYFLSMLGHDIEIEKHFAQINAWKKAPFDVYIVDQKPGDFILIPPLAAHQVWNRGTRTMKVAWNRTTVETLDLALHEALPKARLVCRDEQYKNKAIVYFTLSKYCQQLQSLEEKAELTQMNFLGIGQDIVRNSPRARQLAEDFKELLDLFKEILVNEMFATPEKDVEYLEFDSCVTCSYCRSNIFNRFLTCKHCVRTLITGDEDAYDVCMECYAMGRSCLCMSKLQWCEQWQWSDLVNNYETWRAMVIRNDGYIDFDTSPQPLEVAKQLASKKSAAQVCQEALKRRPWKDITKPEREKTPSDSEQDAVEKNAAKKKNKRKKKKGDIRKCHVCCHKDYSYRVQECTNPDCKEAYCFGVLYRGFDMLPQEVMENELWQCPKCLGICSCAQCRRRGIGNPYTPKNTSLGHDTRAIADDRSIEALVDFRVHNLGWLKAAGEDSRSKDSKRMQRLREQADTAKAQDATEDGGNETQDVINSQASYGAFVDGYGDQRHVFEGQDSPGLTSTKNAPEAPEELEAPLPFTETTDDDTIFQNGEEGDMSAYPDPVLMHQRIGLGYFDKDETSEKILFDHYEVPTAEGLRFDQPDESEFMKKSIRAAKKRARQDEEDPEFVVRKWRKRRRTSERDGVAPTANDGDANDNNMDPALFNLQGSAPAAPKEPSNGLESGQPPVTHESLDGAEESTKGQPAPVYDANEPALRHARPRHSYTDLDEPEINAFDEDDIVIRNTQVKSAAELASEAFKRALGETGFSAGNGPAGEGSPAADGLKVVRRGPGRPPGPRPAPAAAVPIAAEPTVMSHTRSGRAVKSTLPSNALVADEDAKASGTKLARRKRSRWSGVTKIGRGVNEEDESNEGTEEPTDDETGESSYRAPKVSNGTGRRGRPRKSEAAVAPADSDDPFASPPAAVMPSSAQGPRRRGRPRKSEPIAPPNKDVEEDNESVLAVESAGEDATPTAAKGTRPRGRPRKSEVAEPAVKAETPTAFMSMKEHMKLKGRKFKIGTRYEMGLKTERRLMLRPRLLEEQAVAKATEALRRLVPRPGCSRHLAEPWFDLVNTAMRLTLRTNWERHRHRATRATTMTSRPRQRLVLPQHLEDEVEQGDGGVDEDEDEDEGEGRVEIGRRDVMLVIPKFCLSRDALPWDSLIIVIIMSNGRA
ncbi:uncharacterized protein J7T54_005420 [Emericellopsis cladophorae]|uniref:JmjC domain-containing protein n=1 Tax=Emericellopsis cladophorae TaxID=2686198 RepID=A0A9P9XZD9_9HYPO|nr:uncharacterized protein J7T54_005420 [Emericellopsis cladophorae]KAI6780318.1 hypothetical protein J7T54_005420 [Emericellopsis cladophorae]